MDDFQCKPVAMRLGGYSGVDIIVLYAVNMSGMTIGITIF